LLIDTLKQAVVIPTAAVQRGPNGTFVFVVRDDNTTAVRPIQVQKQDETQTVVASGLEPSERVVTTGFARLNDGAKVTVGSADATPATAPQGARPRNGPRPAGDGTQQQRGSGTGTGAAGSGGNAKPNAQQ